MKPHLCNGIDVGCKAHRVGIATPDGSIMEEFDGEGMRAFSWQGRMGGCELRKS